MHSLQRIINRQYSNFFLQINGILFGFKITRLCLVLPGIS